MVYFFQSLLSQAFERHRQSRHVLSISIERWAGPPHRLYERGENIRAAP